MPLRVRFLAAAFVAAISILGCQSAPATAEAAPSAQPEAVAADADPRAAELAQSVMAAMGGREAWDRTRFVRWRFFGNRLHFWDRETGDIRIESPAHTGRDGVDQPKLLILMNIATREGRVWENDLEVEDAAKLAEHLDAGHQIWVNDSYWMFMPYKLLDPGVTLKYSGERELEDGRVADVLDLTFGDGIGYTPENRYEVFVARDSGLVEQWSFFADAANEEPQFTLPWADWKRFGQLLLATGHGQGADWEIAVYDDLPAATFSDPQAEAL
jgi:hypothetical protein